MTAPDSPPQRDRTSTTTCWSSVPGFGGSVTALRLTEKGYKVGVLEAGARFEDADFAKTSFDVKRFLFRPEIGMYGIQRIDAVRDSLILAGAGVGGGSLVYANTLYEPLEAFYKDPQWRDITDWKSELAPYYDQAKRMLGVVENPLRTPSDDVMEKVANDLGVGDTFHPTPVGVFFGGPESAKGDHVADPFFGGVGPDRNTCIACGDCMTGCKYNAKNTLVKNYLYLAEQRGAKVMPLRTVTRVRPRDGGGYDVTIKFTKARRSTPRSTKTLTRRAGRLRGRRDRHPEAAAPDEGRGPPARPLGPPRLPLPHQLRVDPRRDRAGPLGRLQLRHRDHLLLPPRRGHPRRAGALRQGQQRDGAAPDRAHRRRRPRAALADLAEGDVAGAQERRRPLRPQALVGADRRRAGDADPRQLDHDVPQADPGHQEVAPDLAAGPRPAEPDVDPGRQQGGPQDGRRSWAARRAPRSASRSTCR